MVCSQTFTLGIAIAGAATSSAFVCPTPLASGSSFTSSTSKENKCDVGTAAASSRSNRATGVRSLEAISFSFGSIRDIFNRERDTPTSLPQDSKADTAARKKQLAKKQEDYKWSTSGIPVGAPFLEGFPPDEEFPKVPWITQTVASLLKINLGTLRGTIGATEIAEALTDISRAKTFASRIRDLIGDAETGERPVDMEDYEELHAFPVKTPDSVHDWEDDDAFARLRLQGPNCVVLEKCSQKSRDKLKVLDSDPEYKELKEKVDSLMAAGKLYVVDHELLAGMVPTPVDGIPRYLAPSVALFEVTDDDLLPLKPIGIQLSQGDEATPIFMPGEGHNWMIAKACFEAADFIIHEVVSHLGNTHVVLEGPVVAMNRQLPKEHPVYDLLQPHLEGTAFINYLAQELLIVPDGAVDRLQANNIEDSWTMVLEQVVKRIKTDFSPTADFEARQITKKDFPGRYPYRDVGLQYWEATHTWVTEYLDLYYTTDKDMEDDYELNAFVEELTDTAQMKWLDEYKTTSDKKALIAKVLASLIYSASTLHAAVNFPQKPIMSFVGSCPGAMFQPIPTDKTERTFEQFLSFMPPMEIAKIHVSALTLLGSVLYTRLGEYVGDQFDDDRVRTPLAKFQATIEDIELDIVDNNAHVVSGWRARGKDKKDSANFAYKTLLPDSIPQSINI